MEAGIVGLPNVGKSTLFNALTESQGAEAANYPFCTIEPNVGVVAVPDSRLAAITRYIPPQKVIPAALRLVDIAGIVKGASEGEGLGNKFLSHIRNVDAILHVVRCFVNDDITHVDGGIDPIRDIEVIDTELMLSDLQTIETALPKAVRAAKSGDKDAKLRVTLLEKAQSVLAEGKPLRQLELSPEDAKAMKGFGFITAKKVLYVANVDEDDVMGEGPMVAKVRERADAEGGAVVPVCAKLESELGELDAADHAEMLEAVGLKSPRSRRSPAPPTNCSACRATSPPANRKSCAWTIPVGATAPQAAGVIHTDFEKKFIRAEVYRLPELEQYKTEKAIRDAGKLRVEGKEYIVSDGDICHFLTGA